jgi:glycosyltransferase involved in cell wall biosynthesis
MIKITTVVPVHKFNEEVKALLETAVKSFVETSKNNPSNLMFVGPKDVLAKIKESNIAERVDGGAAYVENENSWFSAQINAAAKAVTTDYFAILEYDDEFTPIWFDNVAKYIDAGDDVSVYLPLTEVFDYEHKDEGPIGYVNEAVWASSFSEKLGYFDNECLQDYLIFNTTGGVFKTRDFLEVGGLKESIKLSFWYEFLLRAINKDKNVYVIPKVGYFHTVNRSDSLAHHYSQEMSDRESDFWIELARKEYLYKKDRNKTYEE